MGHVRITGIAAFVVVLALTLGSEPRVAAQAPGADGQATPPASDAQADQADPQTPTFTGGINFVRVDVIVTDDEGRPVTDLSADDFEVLEDGATQSVEQFRLVEVDGNPAPGAEAPRRIRTRADEELEAGRDDVRIFVFFLDDYHTQLGAALQVKEPLIRFIETRLGPNDLVAVMAPLTPLDAVALTRDHGGVIEAIRRFEGRKYRYQPRNEFEQRYTRLPAETVEQIRNQVVMTALSGLSVRLGSLRETRKAVVYVGEGLTVMLPPQLRDPIAEAPGLGNPNARNPLAGEQSSMEDTLSFFSQSDIISRLRDVFAAANRNNTSFYTVDPRGLAGNEFSIDQNVGPQQDRRALRLTQDTLRMMAEETDGLAIVNRNDLDRGLASILRDSSAYYLLGYTSESAPTDGKFHEIAVRVRRPGVRVRARRGYWAGTVADSVRASTPAPEVNRPVQQALASIAPSVQAARYIQTWVGTERAADGRTQVTLVWQALPVTPGARRETPGRVQVTAATAAGDLVYRGRTPDAAGPAGANTAASAAPGAPVAHRVVFDAVPGTLDLRLAIETEDGAVLDRETRRVEVPDLTGTDVMISTPRVFRARTARELQGLLQDATAVPMATREFRRTDRLLLRFDVYAPGTSAPAPVATLLNRSGQDMAAVPVTAAGVGGTHQVDVGLASIPPGEYLIRITVPGAQDDVSELVAFKVGS